MQGIEERVAEALQAGGHPPSAREAVAALADRLEVQELARGAIIPTTERSDAAWFVIDGSVALIDGGAQLRVGRGGLVSGVGLLAWDERRPRIVALEDSRLMRLVRSEVQGVLRAHPDLVERFLALASQRQLAWAMTRALATVLPDVSAEARAALVDGADWHRLQRGEVLYEEGAASDAVYVVVSGEVVVASRSGGAWEILDRITAGGLVGEEGLLDERPRVASVVGHVETWVARLAREDLRGALLDHPESVFRLAGAVMRRLDRRGRDRSQHAHHVVLLRTGGADAPALARRLATGMLGEVRVCTRASLVDEGVVAERRGPLSRASCVRIKWWLDLRRLDSAHVLLVGDVNDASWNRLIVQEADVALVVGRAGDDPSPRAIEGRLPPPERDVPWHLRRALVLLHPADASCPTDTASWLEPRDVDRWFHVRDGHDGDLGRLCRFLQGRQVGLALSGGAARGYAHLGCGAALRECGVPIDALAGASAGAVASCLLAEDVPFAEQVSRIDEGLQLLGSPWQSLTLPVLGLIDNRRATDGIRALFGDRRLEDLWIPVTIVTTDLTSWRRVEHTTGPLVPLLLATSSPPGVAPPVVIDGHLHCDGGVVDNLPVSSLVEAGCETILASVVEMGVLSSGEVSDVPDAWTYLWARFMGEGSDVPNVAEIAMRAMSMASGLSMSAHQDRIDVLFEPPVGEVGFLDFHRYEELFGPALAHGRQVLADADVWARLPTRELDGPS